MSKRSKPQPASTALLSEPLVIRWGPIPDTAQAEVLDDLTPEAKLLFTGGYGSGKTMTMVGKGLQLSHINGDIPGILLVPDYGHFEDTILEKIKAIDPDTGLRWFLDDAQFHYRITRHGSHIFEWEGGGEWHIMSAHNPKSIKGPERAWLIGDEPGSVSWEAWRNSVNRIRHPLARLRQVCGFGTPEGLNWLAQQFTEEHDSYYRVFTMKTADNIELLKHQPNYLQQVAEHATEAELQSYLDGAMVNLTGAMAYGTFGRNIHWREDVPSAWDNPGVPLRISFDFNVDPMACVIGQIVPGRQSRELNIVDAVIMNASWTPQVCEVIARRYGREACLKAGLGPCGWPGGIIIYGDATGGARSTVSIKSNYDFINDILGAECDTFKIHESVRKKYNPSEVSRLNAMRQIFKNAAGQTRCYIRKTSPARISSTYRLVQSLEQTQIAPGHQTINKPAGETHTHASDAMGYLVAAEFPATMPTLITSESFSNADI